YRRLLLLLILFTPRNTNSSPLFYHFSPHTGSPDEALFTEVKALNAFNEDQFADFIGRIFAFLSGQSSAEFMESIGEFAGTHGVNANALKGPLRGTLIISA